jgi:hypothetical protein
MSSEDSPFPLRDAVTPPPPDNRWLQMPVRAFMRPGVVPRSGVRTRPDGPQAGSVDHQAGTITGWNRLSRRRRCRSPRDSESVAPQLSCQGPTSVTWTDTHS